MDVVEGGALDGCCHRQIRGDALGHGGGRIFFLGHLVDHVRWGSAGRVGVLGFWKVVVSLV